MMKHSLDSLTRAELRAYRLAIPRSVYRSRTSGDLMTESQAAPIVLVHGIPGFNDGVVSVASATLERSGWVALDPWSANHYRLINWGENLAPTPLELEDTTIVEKYKMLARQIKQSVE